MFIKKGNKVMVLAGKDKNKQSKVLKVFPKTGKVLVEQVNMVKRHQKKRREGDKGQVVSVAMPIDVSNVALLCGRCNLGSRVRNKTVDGKKLLVCARCDSEF